MLQSYIGYSTYSKYIKNKVVRKEVLHLEFNRTQYTKITGYDKKDNIVRKLVSILKGE